MIKPFSIQEIHSQFGGELLIGSDYAKDTLVDSISTDTRAINAGDLFVALCGDNYDAHDYLQDAINGGAKGLVVDETSRDKLKSLSLDDLSIWLVGDTVKALGQLAQYQRKYFDGQLVAITGSCGKTTVKGMLKSIFVEKLGQEQVFATAGNFNNHIGVPLSVFSMTSQHEVAVIEMGASGLKEIEYLTSIARPNIAMVNNVMPAHVEGFGSIDGIAITKGEIYQYLKSGDAAIVNADSDYASLWLDGLESNNNNVEVLQYSTENAPASQIQASSLHKLKNGCYGFSLSNKNTDQPIDINLSVFGKHNVANALAAASCAYAAGVSSGDIQKGLENFGGEPGRLELINYGQSFTLINDTYNASPGSVKAAIDTLAGIGNESVLVLGDMGELGDESESLHEEIGKYAQAKNITKLLAVGEKTKRTVLGFGSNGQHFSTSDSLVSDLVKILSSEAVVLVKGSRSAHMEVVIDKLKKLGEATNACLVR